MKLLSVTHVIYCKKISLHTHTLKYWRDQSNNCKKKAKTEQSKLRILSTGLNCTKADHLPSIVNGDYVEEEYESEDKITVRCNNGYRKVEGTAVCLTKQKIRGDLPSCEGKIRNL